MEGEKTIKMVQPFRAQHFTHLSRLRTCLLTWKKCISTETFYRQLFIPALCEERGGGSAKRPWRGRKTASIVFDRNVEEEIVVRLL